VLFCTNGTSDTPEIEVHIWYRYFIAAGKPPILTPFFAIYGAKKHQKHRWKRNRDRVGI